MVISHELLGSLQPLPVEMRGNSWDVVNGQRTSRSVGNVFKPRRTTARMFATFGLLARKKAARKICYTELNLNAALRQHEYSKIQTLRRFKMSDDVPLLSILTSQAKHSPIARVSGLRLPITAERS